MPSSAAAWCSGFQFPAPPCTTIVITPRVLLDLRRGPAGSVDLPVRRGRQHAVAGLARRLESLPVEPLRTDHDRGPLRALVHIAHRQVQPPREQRPGAPAGPNPRALDERI